MKQQKTSPGPERAILVQVVQGRQSREDARDSLAELEQLAGTAGAAVLGSITQRRDKPDTAFFVGQGKLEDIQLACREARANLLIFDNELAPAQVNNLDLSVGVKVIDRTELILQIFARRARSSEAQIQVELAQLQYLSSRIPVSEKQQRFQGGIGMRGPGESPFQLRRAPIMNRIGILKTGLKQIQKRRQRTRAHRPWPVICLVGYTNAGKSTLMNALTAADAYVDDRLFATLDTKSRLLYLAPGRQAMLTDTVGFIRNLPHNLVASFRSTLDEIREADILLLVADAGHPYLREHLHVVRSTLRDMKADGVPSLLLFNKTDTEAARPVLAALAADHPGALFISALRKEGLDTLKERILLFLPPFPAAEKE
ncbi:MAG: GTPase HflX [Lentisphaerae bacterium]|nr:GTPase HflX [Lentisphaerota bacterium]